MQSALVQQLSFSCSGSNSCLLPAGLTAIKGRWSVHALGSLQIYSTQAELIF